MNTFSRVVVTCFAAVAVSGVGSAFAQTLPAQTVSATDTVFQALGGKSGIEQIVAVFVPLLLADSRIKHTFVDIDMVRLATKLEEQFCEVSGGPCTYSGKDMEVIHQDLQITNAQFNALVEDLQVAMTRFGIASRTQNKLIARLAPMQRVIVTR